MPDEQQDILRFLPHRPPFVMIDEIVAEGVRPAHSRFTIQPDNILVVDGRFSEAGLVENMAQTSGAAAGITAVSSGESPVVGYIGALKDLRIHLLPSAGQSLDTEVIFVNQVMQAHIVRATVRCESEIIASCEFKIFLQ